MTIRLDTVIMAHPKRERFIPDLLAALDRPARVVYDRSNDRWDTGRRSWQAIGRDASHGLVIQDDALVCRDLIAGVEQALQHVPDGSPVSLYAGRVRPFRDLVQQLVDRASDNTSWLTMSQIHWGVGIVLPIEAIDDMIAWCDERTDVENYDKRISRWCQQMGLTVYYTWPSLVDHRNSPSLVPGRSHAGRHAHRFLGTDASALDRSWTGQTAAVPSLSTVSTADLARGRWRVVGHAARASVATDNGGRANQLHFRGAVLSGVPEVEVRHLLSVGLIEPVLDPQLSMEEAQ